MPTKQRSRPKRYKNTEFLEALGRHCKRLRIQKGYSIDRMSREAEQLSTSVIHRLETGAAPVSVSVLARYAEVLIVPAKQLLDFQLDERNERVSSLKVIDCNDRRVKQGAFRELLPLYSVKAAAGYFGRGEAIEPVGWVEARRFAPLSKDLFVARIVGESMAPRILDGDYGVFRSNPGGTRQGKIVLAEYRGPADPETGGSYTVKKYGSVKMVSREGDWRHKQITLTPLNRRFEPIVLLPKSESDFRIIGELVGLLNR